MWHSWATGSLGWILQKKFFTEAEYSEALEQAAQGSHHTGGI